jgi:methanogenic corrinoid protein MtbC1
MKTEGGHRRFHEADVERLRRRQQGRLQNEEASIDRWIGLLASDAPQTRVVAELLKEQARRATWSGVSDYLGRVIESLGRRWQHGTLSVAQEHVASERLARAIAWVSQTLVIDDDAPVCLLLSAEGDEHTLALSLAELSAREVGWKVTWLGRRTPLADLGAFLSYVEPRVVGVSASEYLSDREELARQHEILSALAGKHGFTLVMGGSGAWPTELKEARRVHEFGEWSRLLHELRESEDERDRTP